MKLNQYISKLLLIGSGLIILGFSLPVHSFSPSILRNNSEELRENSSNLISKRWQRRQAPQWGTVGARRGGCFKPDQELIPLVPPDVENTAPDRFEYFRSVWTTASSTPTIFFYIPELTSADPSSANSTSTTSRKAEFYLLDENEQNIYTLELQLPSESGIISFKLPEVVQTKILPVLEAKRSYKWIIRVSCGDSFDSSSDPEIGSGIELVPVDQISADGENTTSSLTLAQALDQAQPEEYPLIYQKANIWYDAVSSLAELIQANPDNLALKEQWRQLLTDVGYGNIAEQQPIGEAVIIGELD